MRVLTLLDGHTTEFTFFRGTIAYSQLFVIGNFTNSSALCTSLTREIQLTHVREWRIAWEESGEGRRRLDWNRMGHIRGHHRRYYLGGEDGGVRCFRTEGQLQNLAIGNCCYCCLDNRS